jgi:hypothetical protein
MAEKEKDQPQENMGLALSLEGRINIYPERPLPDYTAAGGAAFAARYKNEASHELIALICSRGFHPRIETVNSMRMVDSSSVLKLREGGVVYWPAQNASYYAVAYDRPLAPRYWRTLDETHQVMSEDSVNHCFVLPLIKALLEFQRMGIMHGGIRPTNIFWREGSTTPPQLGDGLSAPAGVGQPALFETIERAMCPPLGRGAGLPVDDCYAFGVTLAMVVTGQNPFQGMDDRTILQNKLEKGTFNCMVGAKRLSASHIELLRGLLMDDARQRWTAEDLEQWMTGRRLTPKSSEVGRRASRHFDIAGKEYWHVRPLAAALAENASEAVKVIENGSLEKWITRSLGDEERAKNVSEAIALTKESGKTAHYQDQLVTRVCIALDPAAPIRYRGLSAMPSGLAPLLAHALSTGENLQTIHEIILGQFVTFWVNMQKDIKVDLVPLAQQLERMRTLAEKPSFGSGLERVAYEMNSHLPSQSPLVRSECVVSPKRLLAALERVATNGFPATEPMDRHIAAFLVARDKRSEALFAAMGPGEKALRRGLALLALFGEMQYRYGPDQVPKLAAWLMPLVEPCLKRFFNKPFEEKVRKQALEAVSQGNLSLLLKRIDDPDRVHGDEQDFLNARLMYHNIKKEMASLDASLKNKENVVREIGRPVAAALASFISILLMAITLGRAFLHSLLGV